MPASFPHTYSVELAWQGESTAVVHTNENPALHVGPPPQFDGPNHLWSPEDMLLSAIQTCLMTTFFSFVRRRPFEVYDFQSRIEGTLDKTSEGLVFTEIRMEVDVETEDPEKAEKLLHTSEKYCIISNALKKKPLLTINAYPRS